MPRLWSWIQSETVYNKHVIICECRFSGILIEQISKQKMLFPWMKKLDGQISINFALVKEIPYFCQDVKGWYKIWFADKIMKLPDKN